MLRCHHRVLLTRGQTPDAGRPTDSDCNRRASARTVVLVLTVAVACAAGLQVRCSKGQQTTEVAAPAGWQSLFDGRTLAGWAPSGFEAEGAVQVVNPFRGPGGAIVMERGLTLSGITWTRGAVLPRMNYEITLEAMRIAGGDFFCGLTFPVADSACTFIVGGWGGEVVGISSIDRLDASENETTREMRFGDHRWYRILVRVTDGRIEASIDGGKVVDVSTTGRTIGLRPGDIQKSLPLGIASYMTKAAIRDIRLRRVEVAPASSR